MNVNANYAHTDDECMHHVIVRMQRGRSWWQGGLLGEGGRRVGGSPRHPDAAPPSSAACREPLPPSHHAAPPHSFLTGPACRCCCWVDHTLLRLFLSLLTHWVWPSECPSSTSRTIKLIFIYLFVYFRHYCFFFWGLNSSGVIYLNMIYGSVSLNEVQRSACIDWEVSRLTCPPREFRPNYRASDALWSRLSENTPSDMLLCHADRGYTLRIYLHLNVF